MSEAKLNSNFIAIVAGDITVFNYDGETREYLSSSVEYLAVGVGIPANSCTDAPGESKEDFTICRSADFTAWEYVADHRGETVYSTETGEAVIISAPGDYPNDTTTLAPPTPYDTWNGSSGPGNGHRATAAKFTRCLLHLVIARPCLCDSGKLSPFPLQRLVVLFGSTYRALNGAIAADQRNAVAAQRL